MGMCQFKTVSITGAVEQLDLDACWNCVSARSFTFVLSNDMTIDGWKVARSPILAVWFFEYGFGFSTKVPDALGFCGEFEAADPRYVVVLSCC